MSENTRCPMANREAALRRLVMAIAVGDAAEFSKMLGASPDLATACFEVANATRRATKQNFVAQLGKYIYRGDTALHFAAAAYAPQMLKQLVKAGANARAKNRLGDEPLHAAACGNPDASHWNPGAQAEIIVALINAGADPGAMNKMGVAPLHKAVRTRCAEAVRVLLGHGADPAQKNRNGSDPMLLARLNTGRGGSGSPQAKAQQDEIIRVLQHALSASRSE